MGLRCEAGSRPDTHSYVIRQLTLRNDVSGVSRPVVQYQVMPCVDTHRHHAQFLAWPDHGVPTSCTPVLELLHLVNVYKACSGYLTLQLTLTEGALGWPRRRALQRGYWSYRNVHYH